jgi:hypothetical protein
MCHDVSVQIHAMGVQQQSTTHSNILLIKTIIQTNNYVVNMSYHEESMFSFAQSLVFYVMFCRSLFVLLSVLRRFTVSGYLFCIFKLFFFQLSI